MGGRGRGGGRDATRQLAESAAGHKLRHKIQGGERQTGRGGSHGIYGGGRDPGYLGGLIWSVGTQVMLMNPVCTLVFAYWSWKFFAMRIPFEEGLLRRMFPGEYEAYAARTPTWIPGIP